MSKARQRSQRKASSMATAAISLQSHDSYDAAGPSSLGPLALTGSSRPLTVRERQQLEDEEREREEKARKLKKRKITKRLDELERTNYRDPLGSVRSGVDSTSRSEEGASSIPNSELEAAVSQRRKQLLAASGRQGGFPSADEKILSGDGQGEGRSGAGTRKQSSGLRRLLSYRRGFYALLEDAASDEVFRSALYNYNTASASLDNYPDVISSGKPKSNRQRRERALETLTTLVYPSRPLFCSVCGDMGSTNCPRCGERTCSRLSCLDTHNDARCDRPIR